MAGFATLFGYGPSVIRLHDSLVPFSANAIPEQVIDGLVDLTTIYIWIYRLLQTSLLKSQRLRMLYPILILYSYISLVIIIIVVLRMLD